MIYTVFSTHRPRISSCLYNRVEHWIIKSGTKTVKSLENHANIAHHRNACPAARTVHCFHAHQELSIHPHSTLSIAHSKVMCIFYHTAQKDVWLSVRCVKHRVQESREHIPEGVTLTRILLILSKTCKVNTADCSNSNQRKT